MFKSVTVIKLFFSIKILECAQAQSSNTDLEKNILSYKYHKNLRQKHIQKH